MRNEIKHIIWSSFINEDEWREAVQEECEINNIEYTEEDLYYMASELNNDYLDDERMNLDICVKNGIIAIADIGLWNRRVCGYKDIGNNISECLYCENSDDAEFYVDSHGVFHSISVNHDGTTYIVFKAWKDNVTEEQKDHITEAIYNGTCSDRMLRRYTRNLGGDIAKVYGWRISTGKKK